MVEIPLLQQHKYNCDRGFSPVKKGEMTPIIKALEETHWLYEILKENFSENPLKLWDKSPRYCHLKLRDPDVIIRVKPMIYTRKDIDEFDNQIKELLDSTLKLVLKC